MRVKLAFLILIGSLLVEAQAIEAPLLFPLLKGRVVDEADLLSKVSERHISDQLEMLENQTGAQVAVATVLSLDGYTIEEYANRLARHWALGQADKDNGALLLVAPNERKVRIEVGYGLEGELTDAMSARIIHEQILPEFRKGRFHTGITSGTDAMITVLKGNSLPVSNKSRAQSRQSDNGLVIFTVFFCILLFGKFLPALDPNNPIRRTADFLFDGGLFGGFGGGGGSFGGGGSSGGW